MNMHEIIAKLRAKPTQDVPFTGMALGDLKRGAAYQAAEDGTLGVDTFWVGGKRRAASIDIAEDLGLKTQSPQRPTSRSKRRHWRSRRPQSSQRRLSQLRLNRARPPLKP